MKPKYAKQLGLLLLAGAMPNIARAAEIDVIATQTVNTTAFGVNVNAITENTTWTSDNIYILKDKVFVANGATLTIQPGTKIYSTLDEKGTPTKDDDAFGSVVITRGAKINAQGTAVAPIIFTTIDELEAALQVDKDGDGFVAEAPIATTAGRWGGLVVLGNAPIANYSGTTNIGEDRIEGFQPAASADLDTDGRADVIEYGGNNAADNSGTISYVSIRHGGYVYAGSSEINGLTLGGVGNGTTIDHVEVYANADDGIEFFGGTVNTSYMAMVFNQDDSFDIDQGYSGVNQFWFAVQNPFLEDGVSSAHDNGGEWDGVTGTIADNTNNSAPTIYNATFIGSGVTALPGNDKGNNAIFVDDRFKGKIYNSVFDDYRQHLIQNSGDGVGSGLTFAHNTVGRFGAGTPGSNLTYLNSAATLADLFFDASGVPINGNSNANVNPAYKTYKRDASNNLISLDPRPDTGSPLLQSNGATLQNGAPVATNFRGAFGSVDWTKGWTRFDSACYSTPSVDVIAEQTVSNTSFGANVNAITVDTTWTADKIYILKDKVFVTNGATLTIQPGTKIYSTLNDKGTPGKDDDAFGSVVITRGAKINALGTAQAPIVFTTIDDLEALSTSDKDGDGFVAEAPTAITAGRWGGLVVLGNAPIANYSGTTNIGEDRIEGFQPAASADLDTDGRADVIEYGGNNAADNSGTISYVSIRHGGYVYAGSSEINGLTLGGVGNGTTIDHVEVYANADDGIEFFGGTVNTSYMAMVFNQDDSFDIDQGYSGVNQFWFAVQNPFLEDGVSSAHDNGGEWDGVTGAIGDNTNNSAPTIYNATFIGSGVTALPGNDKGNNAIFVDDRFKGKIYNSVFDDYRQHLIQNSGDGVGSGLTFAHNTVGRFGAGSYTGSNASNLTYLNSAANLAGTFFDAAGSPLNGNTNGGVDPKFRVYTRSANNTLLALDPRPAADSPLLGASLQPGAPVATTYRGAFGPANWIAGWTKSSETGEILGEAPSVGGTLTDTDGDGISDAVESANTALGFNPNVSNGVPAAVFNGLFTSSSIQDLSADDIIVQKSGNTATLTIPVESSNNLVPPFAPAGNATLQLNNVPVDKQFYRFRVAPDAP